MGAENLESLALVAEAQLPVPIAEAFLRTSGIINNLSNK